MLTQFVLLGVRLEIRKPGHETSSPNPRTFHSKENVELPSMLHIYVCG